MSSELGTWLRGQREARGWSRADMARRLIAAAREAGDDAASSPENLCNSIYRWERGFSGISGPHRLLICRALGISPARFGEHGADGPGQPDGLLESVRGPSNPAVSRLRDVSFKGALLPPVYEQRLAAGKHLPRSADRMSDFGAELERWMLTRGMGVRELHRRSGYSAGYITQLRQGRRTPSPEAARDLDDTLSAAGALAAAAAMPAAVSTIRHRTSDGPPSAPTLGAMFGGVPRGADALASALTDLGAFSQQEPPSDISTLADSANAARVHYQACRYAQLAEGLPGLIRQLNTACAILEGDARDRAYALSADAHHVAASLMIKHGDPGLASLAADRSMRAALASGSPVAIASSARIVTHALMNGGHHASAVAMATSYASRLDRDLPDPTPSSLSVYGALLLRGAVASAQDDNRVTAHELLAEAEDTARRLGQEANHCWTAFGPVNATLHRVNIAVTLGDAGTAIDLARSIHLDAIAVTERKATLLIDTARAFLQRHRHENAYLAIRAAHQTAPEEVTGRAAVRDLVRELAATAPPTVKRDATQFAASIGAAQ